MRELRTELFIRSGLENITENIVMEELEKMFEKIESGEITKYCECWICLSDVAAIVLNDLKPWYFNNYVDKHSAKNTEMISKLEKDIPIKIVEAYERVLKNPHHN